tara:strand:- start:2189 stop:2959 length:771 start_codon:yes stop_codon:yes gene_type:complete
MEHKLIIDAHCHLDIMKGLDAAIKNSKDNGVVKILTNGLEPQSNRKALEYAERFSNVEACLGIYPPDQLKEECDEMGREWKDFDIDKEIAWIKKQTFLAIGEIGMDFVGEFDQDAQEKLFRKMIQLGKEMGKPIIIHSRKAEKRVIEILEEEKAQKVVLHCFHGKKKLVEKIKGKNWFVTIPTNVVRSDQIQELVKIIDINHMFCETDSPFLSPFKGKSNEPSFVIEAYKKIAEIKGMTIEEVENNIYLNYQTLFE